MSLKTVIRSRLSGYIPRCLFKYTADLIRYKDKTSLDLFQTFAGWYIKGSHYPYKVIMNKFGNKEQGYFDFENYKIPLDSSYGTAFVTDFLNFVVNGNVRWRLL